MALDRLQAIIEAEVESAARELLDQARTEAARITEASRARQAAERERRLATARAEAGAAAASRRAECVRSAQDEVLRTRRALLDEILASVRASLGECFEGEAGERLLERCFAEAFALAEGPVAVVCRPELASRVRRLVARHSSVRVETDPDCGWGIVLWTDDARLEMNNTLEAKLEQLTPELAVELVRRAENDAGVE